MGEMNMKKWKKLTKTLDNVGRSVDKQLSKAIGLEGGKKVSHLLNPDSINHKAAVAQLKGQTKDEDSAAAAATTPADTATTSAAAIALTTPSSHNDDDLNRSNDDLELAKALSLSQQEGKIGEKAPAVTSLTHSSGSVQSREVRKISELLEEIVKSGKVQVQEDLSHYNKSYLKVLYDAIDVYPGNNSDQEHDAIKALSGALEDMLEL
jgi:hypothetical protein